MVNKIFKKSIVILYGGSSGEGKISQQSAFNVATACLEMDYQPVILNINCVNLRQCLESITNPLILNLVHGQWGEDGLAQGLFDEMKIPYFGSSRVASELTFNKASFRDTISHFARIPDGAFLTKNEYIATWNKYPHIVKVHNSGSTIGVDYVEDVAAREMILQNWTVDKKIVEEFIPGIEGAVIVYKGELIGGVIVNYNGKIFDYDTKYDPKLSFVQDWDSLSPTIRTELKEISEQIYVKCKCDGFLCVDFRMSLDGLPYILEANSIPGMTQCSLVPRAFMKNGISFTQLVEKMICDAMDKQVFIDRYPMSKCKVLG